VRVVAWWLPLVLVVGAASASACGSSSYGVASFSDAGGDGDGVVTTLDGSIEVGAPARCQIADTVCDQNLVRPCSGGEVGPPIETCADACSLGRCTTAACEETERMDGTRGCRFYGVQVDNTDRDDAKSLMLIISNGNALPANVSVSTRAADGSWQPVMSAVVAGVSGGARIVINHPLTQAGVTPAGALRVDSDAPVTVVEIVSDDIDQDSRSSGGTMLRPMQALGLEHMALTFPQQSSSDVDMWPGSRGGAGAIAVVATGDNTHLTLNLTAPAVIDAGGIAVQPGVPTPVTLAREGDVLQIFSAADGGDLTGTTIDANKQVAVYVGNVYTTYGYSLLGFDGGDMTLEALPPTGSWGDVYVGARLSPYSDCGSFFGGQGTAAWRAVAANDDTVITFTPAPGASILDQNAQPITTARLDRGQVLSFQVRMNAGASGYADFTATSISSTPFLMAQALDCEPALSWAVDTRGSFDDLAFTLPPKFQHEILVVRAKGSAVSLDGVALASARFTPAAPPGQYEIARLTDADLGRCQDLFDTCQHNLRGSIVGVSWRGLDVVCSYALTVPPSSRCVLLGSGCIY
jgi:hypothetical protein